MLTLLLRDTIDGDRYPLSPRIQTLRAIPREAAAGTGSRLRLMDGHYDNKLCLQSDRSTSNAERAVDRKFARL